MERNKKAVMEMKAVAEYVKQHYDLPPDARYKGSEYDKKSDKITIEFEHQKFDAVKSPPVVEKKTEDSKKSSKSKKKK